MLRNPKQVATISFGVYTLLGWDVRRQRRWLQRTACDVSKQENRHKVVVRCVEKACGSARWETRGEQEAETEEREISDDSKHPAEPAGAARELTSRSGRRPSTRGMDSHPSRGGRSSRTCGTQDQRFRQEKKVKKTQRWFVSHSAPFGAPVIRLNE
jgi:hypothetical protein